MTDLVVVTFVLLSWVQSSPDTMRSDSVTFSGQVKRGHTFSRAFVNRLVFELNPIDNGWEVAIRTLDRPEENIARLTPPFHFVPNPRFIEGWHFRNKSNTRQNDGSVSAPQEVREFFFSPRVGAPIDSPLSEEQFQQIQNDGRGTVTITHFELGNLEPGHLTDIEEMEFRAQLFFSF